MINEIYVPNDYYKTFATLGIINNTIKLIPLDSGLALKQIWRVFKGNLGIIFVSSP